LLTNEGNVPTWNPASDAVKEKCGQTADYCKSVGVELATLAIR